MSHPKVTIGQIQAKVVDKKFHRLTAVLTACVLTLENGFAVTGESACSSPENYSQEIGEKFAFENAFNKIWMLEGYLLNEKLFQESKASSEKALGNTDANGVKKNVSDAVFFGDGDMFKILCKASSKSQKWMKSSKAMEVPGGCVVQVTTQQGDHVAEALTFVPCVRIHAHLDEKGTVVGRSLVAID